MIFVFRNYLDTL